MGTREFSQQYDAPNDDGDNEEEEDDGSSSMEEADLLEIELHKSKSAQEQKRSSNLMRNGMDLSNWKKNDMSLLKLDMQQQLKSLTEQASVRFDEHMDDEDADANDKNYKIAIGDVDVDDIDDKDERLPSVKSNLFRNASMEKWSDHSVEMQKNEMKREMLKQLLESSETRSRVK